MKHHERLLCGQHFDGSSGSYGSLAACHSSRTNDSSRAPLLSFSQPLYLTTDGLVAVKAYALEPACAPGQP